MAGQIIKRSDKTWLIRVFVGRDSNTGKRRYQNHTVHGSKKEAQAFLNARLLERDTGTVRENHKMTLEVFLQKWLSEAARGKLRDRTYSDYTDIIRLYLAPALGEVQMEKITPLAVQHLCNQLYEERKLSAPTVRKAHVVLSSALDQAVRWGMLAHNPATSVQLPRSNRGRRREYIGVLNAEQAIRFIEYARKNRWGVLFIVALNSGMRPSESLGLKWEDVDWAGKQISVRRVLYRPRKGGGWRFEEPKTFGSTRSITLSKSTMDELARHKVEQDRERVAVGAEFVDHGLAFAGMHGQPLDCGNLLNQYFKPVVRAAGLDEKLNLYSLRHSHATLLLAAGVHPKVVAERLGHASIQLTLDTYSHVIPGMQQTAVERLETLLNPTSNSE